MTCPACGHRAYQLVRYGTPPPKWMPGVTPLAMETTTHAVHCEIGRYPDTTLCGRAIAGSVTYPARLDVDEVRRMATCAACVLRALKEAKPVIVPQLPHEFPPE